MKPVMWISLITFAGLIFSLSASALEYAPDCAVFEERNTDWTQTAYIDKFDPSLGVLKQVKVIAEACASQHFSFTNPLPEPYCIIAITNVSITNEMPNGDVVVAVPINDYVRRFCLEVNETYEDLITSCDLVEKSYTEASDLDFWTGTGNVMLTATAIEKTFITIAADETYSMEVSDTNADETVCVIYEYDPFLCISGYEINGTTYEGLEGWTINLKDASGDVINTTTTDSDGYYEFCKLHPGTYTVCEVMKTSWIPVGPTCITVELVDKDLENIDFRNEKKKPPCGTGCPWFIKNELYTAQRGALKVVDASKGILANDPAGTIVLNPESITINPKYGTLTVFEDGAFEYDAAPDIQPGTYVIFKYIANNGLCDAKYLGIAKIQIRR